MWSDAGAVEFGGKQALIVDRCGAGSSCDDVDLILALDPAAPVRVVHGKQLSQTDAAGVPTHNLGYAFSEIGSDIVYDARRQDLEINGVRMPIRDVVYTTLESQQFYLEVYSDDDTVPGGLVSLLAGRASGDVHVTLVDKSTLQAAQFPARLTATCSHCTATAGGVLTSCAGTLQVSHDQDSIVISGDPCTDEATTMTVSRNGVLIDRSQIKDVTAAY